MSLPHPLPQAVRDAVAERSWRLVDEDRPHLGWLVGDGATEGTPLHVRRDEPGVAHAAGSVAAELANLTWAAEAIGEVSLAVPEVVAHVAADDDGAGWLVTTVAPGESDLRLLPGADDPLRIIAETLRALHDLDPGACRDIQTPQRLVDHAAARVAAGHVQIEMLHDAYRRSTPDRLVEHLRAMVPAPLASDDEVVVHGAITVHTLRVDPVRAAPTGALAWNWIGRGDRHFDLAVAARSVMRAFGGEAVGGLFDRYGHDGIEPMRLEFYGLADELR